MTWENELIAKALKGVLIVFGLATSLLLLSAFDLQLAERVVFFGLLDHTPASEPALRHWGLMVFGIGVLMVASGLGYVSRQ